MSDFRVYIANIGKYNEGKLVGAWFTPPIDFEDLKEKIGLTGTYEEYAIHDYEGPVNISEYESIESINKIGALLEELEGTSIYNHIKDLLNQWFSSLEDLVDHKDDIICHSDCSSMEDIAYYYINEGGIYSEIPPAIAPYIDYVKYGNDLEMNGNFLVTCDGVFEYFS